MGTMILSEEIRNDYIVVQALPSPEYLTFIVQDVSLSLHIDSDF